MKFCDVHLFIFGYDLGSIFAIQKVEIKENNAYNQRINNDNIGNYFLIKTENIIISLKDQDYLSYCNFQFTNTLI